MAFFIKTPEHKSLGELLGTGISKGIETSLKAKLESQKGLTQYQALQTGLRAKEQKQKVERGVTQTVLTLADPVKGGILKPQDVAPVSREVTGLIKKGMSPSEALDQGVRNYQFQQTALLDLDIGKYKASKAKSLREGVIGSLKKENITNPTLINRALVDKKWPTKERQEVLRSLKGKVIPEKAQEKEAAIQQKMPPASQHVGKVIRDTRTGRKFKSDGKRWTEIR